jgi:hypothetical protein
MEKYKSLHLWMIIPMVFMQLGIFMDYWGDFSRNAWSVHVHYWTGTAWYFFLIMQPYFATRGKMDKHRTYGIIGMFLAGAVCFTALSMMHRDIATTQRAVEFADRFGPFKPWFFFGVAAVEIVMMTAFGYAVIKSILNRKNLEDHAWWLISTVFIIMMPALGRGVQNVWILVEGFSEETNIMGGLYLSLFMILAMLLITAWKFRKLKHPATLLAAGVNLFCFLLEPLGKSESIQGILITMIKG